MRLVSQLDFGFASLRQKEDEAVGSVGGGDEAGGDGGVDGGRVLPRAPGRTGSTFLNELYVTSAVVSAPLYLDPLAWSPSVLRKGSPIALAAVRRMRALFLDAARDTRLSACGPGSLPLSSASSSVFPF